MGNVIMHHLRFVRSNKAHPLALWASPRSQSLVQEDHISRKVGLRLFLDLSITLYIFKMSEFDKKYAETDDVPYGSGSNSENGVDSDRDWSLEEESKAKRK